MLLLLSISVFQEFKLYYKLPSIFFYRLQEKYFGKFYLSAGRKAYCEGISEIDIVFSESILSLKRKLASSIHLYSILRNTLKMENVVNDLLVLQNRAGVDSGLSVCLFSAKKLILFSAKQIRAVTAIVCYFVEKARKKSGT